MKSTVENNKKKKMTKRANSDNLVQLSSKKSLKYQPPNQLLLSYTYFFDEKYAKYISIGFNIADFKPNIIINHIGEASVTLDLVDWICIFIAKQQEIDEAFKSDKLENKKFSCAKNLNVQLNGKLQVLKIDNNSFTYDEWKILHELNDYIQCVMFWCKQLTADVKNYYNLYVAKCVEKYVYRLDITEFFVPPDSISRCNFSRMFYELPILCKEKLKNDISVQTNLLYSTLNIE